MEAGDGRSIVDKDTVISRGWLVALLPDGSCADSLAVHAIDSREVAGCKVGSNGRVVDRNVPTRFGALGKADLFAREFGLWI